MRSCVEEQERDADEQRNQRDAEGPIAAEPAPAEAVAAGRHDDVVHEEVTAGDEERDAEEELAHAAGRTAGVAQPPAGLLGLGVGLFVSHGQS